MARPIYVPAAYQCLQLVLRAQTNLTLPATYQCFAKRDYATAFVSLGLPGSLLQKCYALSLEAFKPFLYTWCPLTTLDTANACTILMPHVMIK